MDLMDGWCLKYANEIQWVISFACTDRLYMYRHACTYAGRYASTLIQRHRYAFAQRMLFRNTLENIDMGNMWQHSSVIFYIEPIPSGPFRSHPSDSQLAVAVVADVTAAYFASRWLRTKSWISCWPIEWRRPKTRNHLSGWERRSRIDEDSLDSPIYDSMMSILSRYIVFLLFFLGIHYIMTNALDHLHVTSMMLR